MPHAGFSMARTVNLPLAGEITLMPENKIDLTGALIPFKKNAASRYWKAYRPWESKWE